MKNWTMTKTAAAVIAAFCFLAIGAFATALQDNRDTPQRSGEFISMTQASNHIYAGSIVCENGSAVAVPGEDATGYQVLGRAEEESDNTGANYSSTQTITVRRGVFRWENGGSFTDANIGDLAYVADDKTVTTAASATYDIVAGVIVDVDASGVWVDNLAIGGQGAAALTTLTTSGAASLNSLTVSGASALAGVTASGNTILTGTLITTGAVTAVASVASPVHTVLTNGVAAGSFKIVNATNLVFIAGTVTNSLDIDIGH